MIIALARATKRAQAPFRAWLPAAMMAPTPVSALVHSSTLVTAGLFLFIISQISASRVNPLWVLVGATLILASAFSLARIDLKNLVALSTLTQLRLVFSFLLQGKTGLGLRHLLLHALFKRALFIRVGILLHSVGGTQDFRHIKGLGQLGASQPLIWLRLLGLRGLPFFSRFYRKEAFLFFITGEALPGLVLGVGAGALATALYCLRIAGLVAPRASTNPQGLKEGAGLIAPLLLRLVAGLPIASSLRGEEAGLGCLSLSALSCIVLILLSGGARTKRFRPAFLGFKAGMGLR